MNSKNLDYKVTPLTTQGYKKNIVVPTSKSHANRLLILAALSPEPVEIEELPESTDVLNMLKAFQKLNIKVTSFQNKTRIHGPFPLCEKPSREPVVLHTGDGGTTNRFLMALLARGKNIYHIQAASGMQARPMEEIETSLRALGVRISKGSPTSNYWYEVQGPPSILSGNISVDCSKSTQFISGLALAFADTTLHFKPVGMETSQSYFEMTKILIEKFQHKHIQWQVPVDFSSLSYPLALALLNGEVTVSNCKERDNFQADSVFLEILKNLGAKVHFTARGLEVVGVKEHAGIDLDCGGFPDLVPTLAFVCAVAKGRSLLRNLEVLHHKESDRVQEILKVLTLFKVHYSYNSVKEELEIVGSDKKVSVVEYLPPADHRIIMIAYLFMRANSGGTVGNAQHVAKSFPRFFECLS